MDKLQATLNRIPALDPKAFDRAQARAMLATTLAQMAAELLAAAADRDARQIDEKLFFEVFALPQQVPTKGAKRR